VIVRDALAPVVATEMNYLAGSDEAPAAFPGTAHAVEYMMFRGSPRPVEGSAGGDRGEHGGAFNADTTQAVASHYFVALAQGFARGVACEIAAHARLAETALWTLYGQLTSGAITASSQFGRCRRTMGQASAR
jgi:hypothetical protein